MGKEAPAAAAVAAADATAVAEAHLAREAPLDTHSAPAEETTCLLESGKELLQVSSPARNSRLDCPIRHRLDRAAPDRLRPQVSCARSAILCLVLFDSQADGSCS